MSAIDCKIDFGGSKVSLETSISSYGGYFVPSTTNKTLTYFNLCRQVDRAPSPCEGGQAANIVHFDGEQPTCESLGQFKSIKLHSGKEEGDGTNTVGSYTTENGSQCKDKNGKEGTRGMRVQLACVETWQEEGMDLTEDDGCKVKIEWRSTDFCAKKQEPVNWCIGENSKLLQKLPEAMIQQPGHPIYTITPCRQASAQSGCPEDSSVCQHDAGKTPIILGKEGKVSRNDNKITVTYADGTLCDDGLPRVTGIDFACGKDLKEPVFKVVDETTTSVGRTRLLYAHSSLCTILSPIDLPPDDPSSSGSSLFSVLFWILVALAIIYFIVGYIYKRVYWNLDGFEAVPNSDSFRAIGQRLGVVTQHRRIQI